MLISISSSFRKNLFRCDFNSKFYKPGINPECFLDKFLDRLLINLSIPVRTQRCIDVKTTSCAYWDSTKRGSTKCNSMYLIPTMESEVI